MTELDLVLRPMLPGDRNYIVSSWLRSSAESREFRRVTRSTFFRLYEPEVQAMLARSTVMVATLPDAPDVILGWLAVEAGLLHYVSVKPRWRRLGVARFLLDGVRDLPVRYTHRPPDWARIPASWTYDPDARFAQEAA